MLASTGDNSIVVVVTNQSIVIVRAVVYLPVIWTSWRVAGSVIFMTAPQGDKVRSVINPINQHVSSDLEKDHTGKKSYVL